LFVFLLTGVWHGANWTFVLWGLYHGCLLVAERLTGVSRLPDERLAAARRAGTFLLVLLGWVLFRSGGLDDAAHFYRAMASLDFGSLTSTVDLAATAQAKLALAVGLLTVLFPRDLVLGRFIQGRWSGAPLLLRGAVLAVVPWAAITVLAGSFSPFLYFQF
jgi:alginate O-acetyltransferase complex protein AlgI